MNSISKRETTFKKPSQYIDNPKNKKSAFKSTIVKKIKKDDLTTHLKPGKLMNTPSLTFTKSNLKSFKF